MLYQNDSLYIKKITLPERHDFCRISEKIKPSICYIILVFALAASVVHTLLYL